MRIIFKNIDLCNFLKFLIEIYYLKTLIIKDFPDLSNRKREKKKKSKNYYDLFSAIDLFLLLTENFR